MVATQAVRFIVVASLGLASAFGACADHVFVVGGGPTPSNSQISIEKNVVYFRSVLHYLGRSDLDPCVLFASGPDASPDVCFDVSDRIPPAYALAADLFGDPKAVRVRFRPHELGPVQGASERSAILAKLSEYAKTLGAGDRLFVYVTGHGGKGDPTSNGYLATWNNDKLPVKQFAEVLDAFDPLVEVVVVMVQCYSGAFANLLFEGGDPSRPLARHRRAGFFATVDSRPAAGCTPDVRIENYKEYSTSFYAGLSGRDRFGKPVVVEDLDGDGRVSFAEAHAYTTVESDTIDVCYRTSDRFLETQARLDPADDKLLSLDVALDELLARADPVRRFALDRLARELKIKKDAPVADARRSAELISKQRKSLQDRINKADAASKQEGERIKNALLVRWPCLRSPWHPDTHALLDGDGAEFVAAVESHPAYKNWRLGRERVRQLREMDLRKERQWAKFERFLLAATSVVRAENLRREGAPELVARYEELLALEGASLAPTGPPAAGLAN
jgi:hypothetical protein